MRKKKRRAVAKKAKKVFLIALIMLPITLLQSFIYSKCTPIIIPIAENEISDIITAAVFESIGDLDASNITINNYDSNGKISSISTDTVKLNTLTSEIMSRVDANLKKKKLKIYVPIGDIIGSAFTVGKGPKACLQITQYQYLDANLQTTFHSQGINQTVYSLQLTLDMTAIILMPGMKTESINVSLTLPVSETLVMGETPKTYISK